MRLAGISYSRSDYSISEWRPTSLPAMLTDNAGSRGEGGCCRRLIPSCRQC